MSFSTWSMRFCCPSALGRNGGHDGAWHFSICLLKLHRVQSSKGCNEAQRCNCLTLKNTICPGLHYQSSMEDTQKQLGSSVRDLKRLPLSKRLCGFCLAHCHRPQDEQKSSLRPKSSAPICPNDSTEFAPLCLICSLPSHH